MLPSRSGKPFSRAPKRLWTREMRIVPKYEAALAKARTQEEASATWAALSEDYSRLNNEVLSTVPDPLRPSVREYLFKRYNGAFPALYDAFVARVNEFSR